MSSYFTVNNKSGLSPFQNTLCYLGGSTIQVVIDNPISTYYQLIQQYTKDNKGELISPKQTTREVNSIFLKNPITVAMSGLKPRLGGVLIKRIPRFGILIGYDYLIGGHGQPGVMAIIASSILTTPFLNPIKILEKQQRITLREMGKQKPLRQILDECRQTRYLPLFRGTIPLTLLSICNGLMGLIVQPKLQKKIQYEYDISRHLSNLVSSILISPLYIITTNPLSRIGVIIQTSPIGEKPLSMRTGFLEIYKDTLKYGVPGFFRGQGVGIIRAILSLSIFHEGRMLIEDQFRSNNYREY